MHTQTHTHLKACMHACIIYMRCAANRLLLGEIYENNLNGLHLKLIKYKYEDESMSIHMGIKIKTAINTSKKRAIDNATNNLLSKPLHLLKNLCLNVPNKIQYTNILWASKSTTIHCTAVLSIAEFEECCTSYVTRKCFCQIFHVICGLIIYVQQFN